MLVCTIHLYGTTAHACQKVTDGMFQVTITMSPQTASTELFMHGCDRAREEFTLLCVDVHAVCVCRCRGWEVRFSIMWHYLCSVLKRSYTKETHLSPQSMPCCKHTPQRNGRALNC